ncbi:integrative conjugative element protein, RAQPRD family [Chitinimonas koreensis]|uniref:integrative conjugative element protein, RAQPRD family n=1 Tax=Chitinimonas koreensis TaxID=356302 RepID=UPI00048D2F9F|nr:RAQPRD family integrative conjugative element protein [Chitinimonas koreensis]QNM96715.1 raqprd family integrative conjugative element protein [Chitinimonas koreensis]
MQLHRSHAFTCCRIAAASLLMWFAGLHPSYAADDALERERLAAITRQLDLIDRLVEQAATTAPRAHVRYYFDYDRLRADLTLVRVGIQNQLAPQRAQPRDPASITGDYTRVDAKAEAPR